MNHSLFGKTDLQRLDEQIWQYIAGSLVPLRSMRYRATNASCHLEIEPRMHSRAYVLRYYSLPHT